MTIRIIDIETTGTAPATDAICEIGSVDLGKTGQRGRIEDAFAIANPMETLVFPGREIPPEASAVHHLIDGDVLDAPRLPAAIERFKGASAYVAHHAEFERGFLDDALGKPQWVCTYKCALRVWPDFPSHSNQYLRYRLGHIEPFGRKRDELPSHRSLSDAICTAAIFAELLLRCSWKEVLQWSTEPALHTTLSFGKHRGMRYDAAPRDYLQWLAEKSEMDEGVKHSARHWLAQMKAA